MRLAENGYSTTRPVILGKIAAPKRISTRRGGGGRVKFNSPEER